MKNTFENTGLQDSKTNWLAEELRYESRISVWESFDNAVALDAEHRENCAAEEAEIPSSSPRKRAYQDDDRYPSRRPSSTKKRESQKNQEFTAKIIIVIVIIYLIIGILAAFI